MRWFIFVVILAIVGIISVVYFSSGFFERHSYYKEYGSAKQDGALEAGWLPPFLPESAKGIRLWTNAESNEAVASYKYAPEDSPAMVIHCERIPFHEVVFPRSRVTKILKWWPKNLREKGNDVDAIYDFYRCGTQMEYPNRNETHPSFLALDPRAYSALLWQGTCVPPSSK